MNKKCTSRNSRTDWERLDNMSDEDIEFSDVPEISPEMFGKAIARKGLKPLERKSQIIAGVTPEILDVVLGNSTNNPSFEGLMPNGSIRKTKIKFISHCIYVSKSPRDSTGKQIPIPIHKNADRTYEKWFIDGVEKPKDWNGKP